MFKSALRQSKLREMTLFYKFNFFGNQKHNLKNQMKHFIEIQFPVMH